MLPRILTIASCLIFANVPARALQVSGMVQTKLGDPISGAIVCIKSDPTKCVTTNSAGEFNLSSANGIIKSFSNSKAFSMDFKRGQLAINAPTATKARVEWISAAGKVLSPTEEMSLVSGRNFIPVPNGLAETGVYFIRLNTREFSLTWKAQMLGNQSIAASGNEGSSARRVMALSKVSAIAPLIVTKTGYVTETYLPEKDPETDALILLRSTNDVGVILKGTFKSKIISIDRSKKIYISESVDAQCSGERLVRDTTRDTTNYAIRNGKLIVWTAGECRAAILSGTSTDIVGTWTFQESDVELPADLRVGCDPTLEVADEFAGSLSGVAKISETQIIADLGFELCPGDLYGPLLFNSFQSDTSVSLIKNTCRELTFENAAKEPANLNFSVDGDSLKLAFNYKTSVCTGALDFGISDKDPVCPEGQSSGSLYGCILGSGFSTPNTILAGKTSATSPRPMSLESKSFPVNRPNIQAKTRRGIFSQHGWNFKNFR